MVRLVCRGCGAARDVADTLRDGTPALDWFASVGEKCASCRGPAIGRTHVDGHETEQAAAESQRPTITTARRRVLEAFRAAGSVGRTDYENYVALGLSRPHVAGTRREELIAEGVPIVKSGVHRATDTGRKAIVWVLQGAV